MRSERPARAGPRHGVARHTYRGTAGGHRPSVGVYRQVLQCQMASLTFVSGEWSTTRTVVDAAPRTMSSGAPELVSTHNSALKLDSSARSRPDQPRRRSRGRCHRRCPIGGRTLRDVLGSRDRTGVWQLYPCIRGKHLPPRNSPSRGSAWSERAEGSGRASRGRSWRRVSASCAGKRNSWASSIYRESARRGWNARAASQPESTSPHRGSCAPSAPTP